MQKSGVGATSPGHLDFISHERDTGRIAPHNTGDPHRQTVAGRAKQVAGRKSYQAEARRKHQLSLSGAPAEQGLI